MSRLTRLPHCTLRMVNNAHLTKAVVLPSLSQKYFRFNADDCNTFHTCTIRYEKKPSIQLGEENIVQRIYKKFFRGIPQSKLRASGFILLSHCSQLQQLEKFFREFDMPDSFYSWFLVTELHVWMLASRLMEEGDYGREVRNAMVEALWQDCETRAKSIGDLAASVRSQQIIDMSEEFQAALFVYDEGLLSGDKELANALWRRFFLSMKEDEEKQAPDMEKVALLVDYVRRNMQHLDNTDPFKLIVKNEITWQLL